jgi:hypothetical protein
MTALAEHVQEGTLELHGPLELVSLDLVLTLKPVPLMPEQSIHLSEGHPANAP